MHDSVEEKMNQSFTPVEDVVATLAFLGGANRYASSLVRRT